MKQKTAFKNNLSAEDVEKLTLLFPEAFNIKFGEIQYGGKILIFICSFKDSKFLKQYWREINSYLAAEYLSNENEEFSRWNFYIFYVCSNVDKATQYEIENNKFCSRKIVIDKNEEELSEGQIIEIIDEHITNDNLLISINESNVVQLQKNTLIAGALEHFKQLNNKKQYGEYLENILTQLEKDL